MKNKKNKITIPDKNFDGHLEKPLNKMTPVEKLDYIWEQIELRNFLKKNVKRVGKNK